MSTVSAQVPAPSWELPRSRRAVARLRRFLRRLFPGTPSEEWIAARSMMLANAIVPRRLDRGHFALIGSTGSGKSTLLEILIASIFRHLPEAEDLHLFNGFILDPQNDLYRPLMAMDLPVNVILTNVLDSRAWAWDMSKDVTDPASAWQFAFAALPDDTTSNENRFYNDAPRFIFAGVLRELVNRKLPWTLRQAYLLAMDDSYAEQLMRTSTDPGVRHVLRLFSKEQGSTRSNIDSSLLTKLGNLELYAALMEHAPHRFSLREMVRSEVVMVAGGDFKFSHIVDPMNYLMLTWLKNELIGQEKAEDRRHYIFIDEFAALNDQRGQPAKEVLDFFVRGRSRGCRIGIIIHSPQQLVDIYGEPMTNVILGQCQNKLILKVSDPDGAEYCSRLLGHVFGYEWTHSVNVSHTYGMSPSSTHATGASEQRVDYPKVHRDLIMDLPLASIDYGFHGYGIIPSETGTLKWRFHLPPTWLSQHMVQGDLDVPSYEACRRTDPDEQRLKPLSQAEVEEFGLIYHESAA